MKITQISIKRKTTTALSLVLSALVCFALCQQVQSATDTPDPGGSLPVSNTADGHNALLSLTTGIYNSAFGFDSLLSLTDGNFCTAVGGAALILNTGSENTATGAGALLSNSTGARNTANGAFALFNNSASQDNTAIGDRALQNNTSDGNTAVGSGALIVNSSGGLNTAVGAAALVTNTSGSNNTAVGLDALFSNIDGSRNTAVGRGALGGNIGGSDNVALGQGAGDALTTGDANIDIGYNVHGAAGESNTIRIGAQDITFTATFIQGISGATAAGGDAVFVTSGGHLGTLTSSARFKDEIKPMGNASEAILALRPVSFRYKKQIDPQGIPEFGLIAEEVEKVNPGLITRDKEGKPYTVRYEQINAMLLNEFLKEHRTVQELRNEIAALTSTVKEQAAQIQKVSAQVEASKSAPQVVLNNQ